MCLCDGGDARDRTAIDQNLMAPAKAIADRSGGGAISDAAWDVFFGRASGAVSWPDLCVIRQSYEEAAAIARVRAAFRREHVRRRPVCEP